jgi:hypothetical protein
MDADTTGRRLHKGKLLPRAELRCFTRALKNGRHLQKVAPHTFAKDTSAEGFGTGVPIEILNRLHRLRADAPELRGRDDIAEFLRKNRLPLPGRNVRDALFNGTIYFRK